LGDGLFKLDFGYDLVSKLQDRVLICDEDDNCFDAPGNLGTGKSRLIHEWLARLQHADMRLPLVFLSVCESAPVARKFVEAGVGVAVGFEKEVLPEMCRTLAVPVISAALNSAGNRRAILEAYNEVFKRDPAGATLFKPKAFYSVR